MITVWRQDLPQTRRLLIACLGLNLVIGFVPLGALLLRPLETRFPARPEIIELAGIIILGGGEDAAMSIASGQPELNAAAERFVLGQVLAQTHPAARVIFTGGSGSVLDRENN